MNTPATVAVLAGIAYLLWLAYLGVGKLRDAHRTVEFIRHAATAERVGDGRDELARRRDGAQ